VAISNRVKRSHLSISSRNAPITDDRTSGRSIVEIAAPPSEAAELEAQLRVLHNLIDQFGPMDKALVLLYLDGNSNDAIGEILGISVTNVSTRINRIKQRLQRNGADVSKTEYSHGLR